MNLCILHDHITEVFPHKESLKFINSFQQMSHNLHHLQVQSFEF